jgi:hypothetical protein
MSDHGRIVWILGAGFSKSLGGPLLPDLLSERVELEMRGRFSKLVTDVAHQQIYIVYRYGLNEKRSKREGLSLWNHAEEFLAYLGDAASGHPTKAITVNEIAKRHGIQPGVTVVDPRSHLKNTSA